MAQLSGPHRRRRAGDAFPRKISLLPEEGKADAGQVRGSSPQGLNTSISLSPSQSRRAVGLCIPNPVLYHAQAEWGLVNVCGVNEGINEWQTREGTPESKGGAHRWEESRPQQTRGRDGPGPTRSGRARPERPSGSPGRCGQGSSSRMASLPRVLGPAFRREAAGAGEPVAGLGA